MVNPNTMTLLATLQGLRRLEVQVAQSLSQMGSGRQDPQAQAVRSQARRVMTDAQTAAADVSTRIRESVLDVEA